MLTKLSLFAAVSAISLRTSPEEVQSAIGNADAAMDKLNDDLVKLSSTESEAESEDDASFEDGVEAEEQPGVKVTYKGKVLDITAADEVVEAYTDEQIDALMGYSDADPNGIEFADDAEEAQMTETERSDLEDADEAEEAENPFLIYGGMEDEAEESDVSEEADADSEESEEGDEAAEEAEEIPAEEDEDMLSLAKAAGKTNAVAFLSNTKLGLPRRRHRWSNGGSCDGGIRRHPGRGDQDDSTTTPVIPAG